MSYVMDMILNRKFRYEQPWFYQNELALRCELGIGDDTETYMKNAHNRADIIFDILFPQMPDAFFFDHMIYDFDDDEPLIGSVRSIVSTKSKVLTFRLQQLKRYRYTIVRDLPRSENNIDELLRINRIVCYPSPKYDPKKQIFHQIESCNLPLVSFVSEEHECIFSIYDDRGCDIVFFDAEKFKYFYPLLEPYFLEYDKATMKQRLERI